MVEAYIRAVMTYRKEDSDLVEELRLKGVQFEAIMEEAIIGEGDFAMQGIGIETLPALIIGDQSLDMVGIFLLKIEAEEARKKIIVHAGKVDRASVQFHYINPPDRCHDASVLKYVYGCEVTRHHLVSAEDLSSIYGEQLPSDYEKVTNLRLYKQGSLVYRPHGKIVGTWDKIDLESALYACANYLTNLEERGIPRHLPPEPELVSNNKNITHTIKSGVKLKVVR